MFIRRKRVCSMCLETERDELDCNVQCMETLTRNGLAW